MKSKWNKTFTMIFLGPEDTQETWSESQKTHEAVTRVEGAPRGVGRASLPRGFLEASLTSTPSLLDCFRSKNNSPEGFIPFGLRLLFLFYKTVK